MTRCPSTTTWLIALWITARLCVADDECGVYLAKSTIPHAGFGMFAGHAHDTGDVVVDGDLVVPLEEVEWNNGFEDWLFVWDDYTWSSNDFFYVIEEIDDGDDIPICSFGVGAAMNSFLPLVNVHGKYLTTNYAGLHRSHDVGVGAFTPYHDRKTLATRNIKAGEELFVSYGNDYFAVRNSTYGYVPLFEDFDRADLIVKKFLNLESKLSNQTLACAVWDLITSKFYDDHTSRTLNALPKNYSDIEYVSEKGTSYLHYNRSIQSLDYLKEHGKCMDNIRPGLSTIPQAGRGAFCTRFIKKGGLVAPAPLIHIPEKHRFDMYDPLPVNKDGTVDRNLTRGVVRQQLLLNYCFSHSHSTMLLSSYGAMTNLINHSSKKPNARIVWSDMSPHAEWMNKSIPELTKINHAGLMFDYVALRDIDEGEEVLIDYGDEWERAWNEHVENWKPPKNAKRYRAGFELTDNVDSVLWLNTEYPYYAGTVEIWIHALYADMSGVVIQSRNKDVDYHMVRIVGRYMNKKGEHLYNAEIIERKDNKLYSEEPRLGIVFGLPRDAFYFEDNPYTRDHQLHSSFRHAMMVPDDVFPEAWKNVL